MKNESSLEEIKQQFEPNVFGVIRITKAVIPTMRKQGNGHFDSFRCCRYSTR